jgi:membrane-associated phospholipid phosphatase
MSANELLGPLHREHTTDQRVHPILATMGIAVVGFLVLAALTLAMGALVTQFVVGHGLGDADHDVARWFADHRTPSWNDVSAVGSDLAGTVTVLAILVVAIVLLGVRRKWAQIGLFTVSLSVEGTVYLVATYFVTRNRPAVPRLEALIVADSFPSGHTAASVALYGALAVCALSLTETVVAGGGDRARDRAADRRRDFTGVPRDAQSHRRVLRRPDRRRVCRHRLCLGPCRRR